MRTSFCLKKVRIIGIRGIIRYSRQVCNLLFLAFQYYSSPGGSTTAGEVCYLRLPCLLKCGWNGTVKIHRTIDTLLTKHRISISTKNFPLQKRRGIAQWPLKAPLILYHLPPQFITECKRENTTEIGPPFDKVTLRNKSGTLFIVLGVKCKCKYSTLRSNAQYTPPTPTRRNVGGVIRLLNTIRN